MLMQEALTAKLILNFSNVEAKKSVWVLYKVCVLFLFTTPTWFVSGIYYTTTHNDPETSVW